MRIIVQNKQRLYKISLAKLEGMAAELAVAVFNNLRMDETKREWSAYLKVIESSAALSLIIVSPQAIKKLNKQWLHKDKETDVLSFPLLDFNSVNIRNELEHLYSEDRLAANKEGQCDLVEFGEIFISYAQAIKQAEEYNHSLERELAFLFVHGLLHIFGFDHQDVISEKEMFGKQQKILNEKGYFR